MDIGYKREIGIWNGISVYMNYFTCLFDCLFGSLQYFKFPFICSIFFWSLQWDFLITVMNSFYYLSEFSSCYIGVLFLA